jgi:hypothetical protein
LGNRDKWTDGNGKAGSGNAGAFDFDRTPIVTRDQVKHAKPDPDLFVAAAARLGIRVNTATVVGDSVWDMLAAASAPEPLALVSCPAATARTNSSVPRAYRVYEDPADLLKHIDEVVSAARGAVLRVSESAKTGSGKRRWSEPLSRL